MFDYVLLPLWTTIDQLLILPFRIVADPMAGFLLGSFCLALLCAMLGELILSQAIRFNRRHIDDLKRDVAYKEALSLQARAEGDRAGYKALNQQANDAWGRHFFAMAAYSAGMLLPVPFALAWMQVRFQAVEFGVPDILVPVLGDNVGYPFFYIPLYILARCLFGRMRAYLPYFHGVQKMLDQSVRTV